MLHSTNGTCREIDTINDVCFKTTPTVDDASCGISMEIYEDCAVDTILFKIKSKKLKIC